MIKEFVNAMKFCYKFNKKSEFFALYLFMYQLVYSSFLFSKAYGRINYFFQISSGKPRWSLFHDPSLHSSAFIVDKSMLEEYERLEQIAANPLPL